MQSTGNRRENLITQSESLGLSFDTSRRVLLSSARERTALNRALRRALHLVKTRALISAGWMR
jgi:hypothetical protein